MSTVTESPAAADNGFIEGNHPDAYDFRGNFNGNQDQPAAPEQVTPVPAETAGYQGAGGTVRQSIRDRIAAVRPYVSETVDVPEWDSKIEVRSISLGERQAIMAGIMDEDGTVRTADIEASFILAAAFDPETGEKVFGPDDLEFVQTRAAGPADRVGKVAMRLSGMGQTEDAAKKS